VVVAAFDHLDPGEAGQLGVLAAGVVGGADQGGAQQPVAGLGDGLALAVGLAGLGRLGGQAGEGPEPGRGGEAAGWAHGGDQGGPADGGQAGQAAGQGGWVDAPVAGLPLAGVPLQLGLGGPQQPDLGGDLGSQLGEGDGGVVAVQLQGGLGSRAPLGGPAGALLAVGGLGDQAGKPGSAGGQQAWGSG
jgi:hypothetical protein